MLGFLASRGEEFNPGPVTRLDDSELLYNKVLLKYVWGGLTNSYEKEEKRKAKDKRKDMSI